MYCAPPVVPIVPAEGGLPPHVHARNRAPPPGIRENGNGMGEAEEAEEPEEAEREGVMREGGRGKTREERGSRRETQGERTREEGGREGAREGAG